MKCINNCIHFCNVKLEEGEVTDDKVEVTDKPEVEVKKVGLLYEICLEATFKSMSPRKRTCMSLWSYSFYNWFSYNSLM